MNDPSDNPHPTTPTPSGQITQAMRDAAPEPLYGCKARGCAEQKSVRAAELRWYQDGFYCELCIDGMAYAAMQAQPDRPDDRHPHTGATLAQIHVAGLVARNEPEPCYPCAIHECAIEVSYPADMLSWFQDGFYCEECIANDERDIPDAEDEDDERQNGPTLADVLKEIV